MRKRGWAVVALAALAGPAAGGEPPADPRVAAALSDARQAATQLGEQVRGLLMAELARGGHQEAVRACAETAQKATEEFRARSGREIRRVSLRPRNPRNAPDAFERERLADFDRARAAGGPVEEAWQVVREEGGVESLRYLRPIPAVALCLNCHGAPDEIAPAVRAILAERYPADQATGYATGDVRGAVSVRIPLDPAR